MLLVFTAAAAAALPAGRRRERDARPGRAPCRRPRPRRPRRRRGLRDRRGSGARLRDPRAGRDPLRRAAGVADQRVLPARRRHLLLAAAVDPAAPDGRRLQALLRDRRRGGPGARRRGRHALVRQQRDRGHVGHGAAAVLQLARGLRVRQAPLPRPRRDLPALPGHDDGPADRSR